MKKINNKGFVLAETLIVTIFVLTIFTLMYSYYYPTIGLYEERENYDNVDGKYTAYWIKRLIESSSYNFNNNTETINKRKEQMNRFGYIRFECKDVEESNNRRNICKNLVNALEISNCNPSGNECDIFITPYQIGGVYKNGVQLNNLNEEDPAVFVETVNGNVKGIIKKENEVLKNKHMLKRYDELYFKDNSNDISCAYATDQEYTKDSDKNSISQKTFCKQKYMMECLDEFGYSYLKKQLEDSHKINTNDPKTSEIVNYCEENAKSAVFQTALKDYINFLPNYNNTTDKPQYRVIISVHHQKAYNDYYSFSTMEVDR